MCSNIRCTQYRNILVLCHSFRVTWHTVRFKRVAMNPSMLFSPLTPFVTIRYSIHRLVIARSTVVTFAYLC